MAALSRQFAVLLVLLICGIARADPPGRVGRLSDLQGAVWLYDADTAEWVAAPRNRPMTSGDRLSTDGNARAELRIGSSTLRLGAGTEVELLQLDDATVRVQLHSGLLALRLRTHDAAAEFELVTAEGRFKPERAGRYRLDRIDATSRITVWSGQLLFEAPDNAVTLVAGQRADIWNNGRTQYTLVQPQPDAFADEVAASELSEERSVSANYVSPEMTGFEDLDRYGRWANDAEYGALWIPQALAPGWVPYRYGQWAWIRPWGWTWVDDARWGFAPFHYGRWIYLRNTWCWAPGTRVARPVFAPALVAWVGALPAGRPVGIGPTVGWFPLAPREVFVPGYRSSPNYVRNVNLAQVTNIANVPAIIDNPDKVMQQTNYVNRSVPGAVTVVPASVVSGRQPVAPSHDRLADPRPGAGNGPAAAATTASVSATAPVSPAPWRGSGVAAGRPIAASPGATVATGSARTTSASQPTQGGSATTIAPRNAVPPPPRTQPLMRGPRTAVDTAAVVPSADATPSATSPPMPTAPPHLLTSRAPAPPQPATIAPQPPPRGPVQPPRAAMPARTPPGLVAPTAVQQSPVAPTAPVAQPPAPRPAEVAGLAVVPAPGPHPNEARDESRARQTAKDERR